MITTDRTLGELARNIPGASQIFHEYSLRFCCGGDLSLGEAASAKGLDPQTLIDQLEALPQESDSRDWSQASREELIEFILTRYHDVHRDQFPEMIRLAERVERVHGGHVECPSGLANHLIQMEDALETHMQKEEEMLFPMLARGMSGIATQPVELIRHEHGEQAEAIRKLERLTHNVTPPADACNTWHALYAGVAQFRRDLMEHIHLENNVLFADLPASA